MQLQPDYTSQLNAIAEALSRPGPSTRAISLYSAGVGAALALAVQFVLRFADGYFERQKLRKVLYRDIGKRIIFINATMEEMKVHPELHDYYSGMLEEQFATNAEAYLNGRLELYTDLSEHSAAESLYREFRAMVEKPIERHTGWSRILWMLGYYLEEGAMRERCFRKFVPRGAGARAVELAKTRYARDKQTMAAAEDGQA